MRPRFDRPAALLAPALITGLFLLCSPLQAAAPARFSGKIIGMVKGASGVAQMGATVQLLNRFEKPILRAITDERGAFVFDALGPDSYGVRVSMTSFMPVTRMNIQVGPGIERFLAIQMASLFSSVEIFYSPPPGAFLMSEDWRAALRSSLSTRPVLRALPGWDPNAPSRRQPGPRLLSDTRAVVQLASGDTTTNFSMGSQPDLGTAFAVGTSVWGRNQVHFSGNLAYGLQNGIPSAGFRTTYQRAMDSPNGFDSPNPLFSLTVRQLYLPSMLGPNLPNNTASRAPVLRSITSTFIDRWQLSDRVLLEYGAALDSVQFFERINYLSPFGRMSWDGQLLGTIKAAYSSGLPPVDLLIRGTGPAADIQRELSGLALFPRITRRGGTTQAQRVENMEIGYSRNLNLGEVFASVYREAVSNAGLATIGASASLLGQDLVPDLSTNASLFNIGNFNRNGFLAGWTQNLPGNWRFSTAYGLGGILRTDQRSVLGIDSPPGQANAIRAGIHRSQKHFASMKLSGIVPLSGTRFYSSYLWTDYRALTPFHTSLTTTGLAEAGLNFGFRQPIRGFPGLRGRLEFSAEMRNMLAQGYVPIVMPDGRTMWLLPTPKQVRGGLSFIF